jgi:hypothetical protein
MQGYSPAKPDDIRDQRYARRAEEERRMREARAEGEQAYDPATHP